MLRLSSEDRHFLHAVLSPSWLSGLVIVVAALVVTGGSIITFSLNHSAFKQDLIGWEQAHTDSVSLSGQSTQSINPTLANSWPLIIVWAGVGLLTYTVASSIVRFITETMEFKRELNYVHADRSLMVQVTVEHLITRLVAATLLLFLVLLFVFHLLPYTINAGNISAGDLRSVTGVRYALSSFFITAVSVYLATILLRLSLGKARIFSST